MNSITIIRHAETDWAATDRHTGLTDIPLNKKGEAQAKKLSPLLEKKRFDHLLISPLQRVQETARLSGVFEKASIDRDLVEWDYGKYEGLTSQQIHEVDPTWNIFTEGAPGGESIDRAVARAERVLKKLKALSGEVLIISSGHFSRLLASRWLGMPPSFGLLIALYPASISSLGYLADQEAILTWNAVEHLD